MKIARMLHRNAGSAGLLRAVDVRNVVRLPRPPGVLYMHNVPLVRTISFARALPKLATKLLRIPAMFGGATVAGLAYIQYQASRKLVTGSPVHGMTDPI